MKKYRIHKTVVLGFLDPQEQYDVILTSEDNVILESDGQTIWIAKDGKRHESITQAHAIKCWLIDGLITEIS